MPTPFIRSFCRIMRRFSAAYDSSAVARQAHALCETDLGTREGEGITALTLARRMGVTANAARCHLHRLHREGLVTLARVRPPRGCGYPAIFATLTEAGHAFLADLDKAADLQPEP